MNDGEDTKRDDELMALAARLDRSVTPGRDLWPSIEQAIATPARRQPSFWNGVFAQAAMVLLLVGASSGVTWYVVSAGQPMNVSPVGEAPAYVFEPVSGSFGSRYNLGPDYIDARRNLQSKLDLELAGLTPEARAEVTKNMETIRQAIEDINIALADEPDNVLLQELLLSAYREELSLMRRVDGIVSAAMLRGDF